RRRRLAPSGLGLWRRIGRSRRGWGRWRATARGRRGRDHGRGGRDPGGVWLAGRWRMRGGVGRSRRRAFCAPSVATDGRVPVPPHTKEEDRDGSTPVVGSVSRFFLGTLFPTDMTGPMSTEGGLDKHFRDDRNGRIGGWGIPRGVSVVSGRGSGGRGRA